MSECKSVSSACSHSLIFLIFSFSLIQFVEGICPDAKSIEPCTCNDEGLQCLRLDDDDLERVFSADAQRKAIRRVWIFQTNLTKLKPNAFGDYIIGDLFLDINKIDFVDEDAFGYASKTLKLLSLTRNRLTTFPFDVLKKSPRLDKFSLAFNQLTRLPNTIESSKLTHLDLSYNSITDIAPHTFYWMTGLQILNLARNMLTTIKTHALWMHATGPLTIILRGNLIDKFEPQPFGPRNLSELDISKNQLNYLDEEVFLPLIESGTEISTADNPFACWGCQQYRWLVEKRNIVKSKLIDFKCSDNTELEELTLSKIGCQ